MTENGKVLAYPAWQSGLREKAAALEEEAIAKQRELDEEKRQRARDRGETLREILAGLGIDAPELDTPEWTAPDGYRFRMYYPRATDICAHSFSISRDVPDAENHGVDEEDLYDTAYRWSVSRAWFGDYNRFDVDALDVVEAIQELPREMERQVEINRQIVEGLKAEQPVRVIVDDTPSTEELPGECLAKLIREVVVDALIEYGLIDTA